MTALLIARFIHRTQGRSPPLLATTATMPRSRTDQSRPSSDMSAFRDKLASARRVVALTGAGISAESGVPTFRGSGGLWRKYRSQDLATPSAFASNPGLVWEFYSYRRELVLTKQPNAAHYALSDYESRLAASGGSLTVITQNIDELHRKAGSNLVLELHGTLFKTRCQKCGDATANHDSPVCPAMAGRGDPDPAAIDSNVPIKELPHCRRAKCNGLLRPHVTWFGESLDPHVLKEAEKALDECDICLVIGTSSIVYPAAMFAPQVAARGVPVAEFNIESTPSTDNFGFHFDGPCGTSLPEALRP